MDVILVFHLLHWLEDSDVTYNTEKSPMAPLYEPSENIKPLHSDLNKLRTKLLSLNEHKTVKQSLANLGFLDFAVAISATKFWYMVQVRNLEIDLGTS